MPGGARAARSGGQRGQDRGGRRPRRVGSGSGGGTPARGRPGRAGASRAEPSGAERGGDPGRARRSRSRRLHPRRARSRRRRAGGRGSPGAGGALGRSPRRPTRRGGRLTTRTAASVQTWSCRCAIGVWPPPPQAQFPGLSREAPGRSLRAPCSAASGPGGWSCGRRRPGGDIGSRRTLVFKEGVGVGGRGKGGGEGTFRTGLSHGSEASRNEQRVVEEQ
jgi:hypothetical protein